MLSSEFLLTATVVVLMPGTGVIYTLATGLTQGRRASVYAALGCTFGIVPHLLASVFGLAALLHTSAVAFQWFKVVGVLYLAYLAWSMWRSSGQLSIESKNTRHSARHIFTRAALINVLNPKLSIFFLAFFPQFVPTGTANPLPALLLLSGIFMLITLAVFIVYGLLAHQVSRVLCHSPKGLQRLHKAFAGLFVGLGAKLALMER